MDMVRLKRWRSASALFPSGVLGVFLLLMLLPGRASAEMYRWTTPDGAIHFGDSMPSSQAARGYEIIDPQSGDVIRQIHPAKTPQELAAEAAAKQAAAEQAEAAAEQARQDQMLLDLYSSTADIKRARDQRLGELDAQIKQMMAALMRASVRSRSSNPTEAESAGRDLAQLRKNIADLNGVRDAAARQFDRYLQRYKILTAHKKDQAATP